MGTPREDAFDGPVVNGAKKAVAYLDIKSSEIPGRVAQSLIRLPNGKERKLGDTVGWIDNNVNVGFAKLQGSVDGLAAALSAATTNPAIDPKEVRAILEDAAQKAFGKFELEVRRTAEAQEGGDQA